MAVRAASERRHAELDRYAGWGNTKSALVIDPQQSGAVALADALAGVVSGLGLSSCCVLNHCATEPEPKDPGAVCGDGRVEGDEKCDDGANNATYGHCGGRCKGPHLYCGDARLDAPEQCDDGNMQAGDGCDARCLPEVEPGSDSLDGGGVRADAGDAHVARPTTIRPLGAPLDASVASSAPRGQAPRDEGKASDSGSRGGPLDGPAHSRDGGCTVVAGGAPQTLPWLLVGLASLLRRRHRAAQARTRG